METVLMLQEPWVNPHTLLPPPHSNWHLITSYNHNPTNWRDRHKCCIYVHKLVPSEAITQHPDGSKHLIGITIQGADGKTVLMINIYNPPGSNAGLKDLMQWLPSFHHRQHPTCLCMDANLHHRMWNPIGYHSTHKEAADLIHFCGKHGFRLASPRHIPKFYTTKGKGTTIDLTWTNHRASNILDTIHVSEENFGPDHQSLKGSLHLTGFKPKTRWAKPIWKALDQKLICKNFEALLDNELNSIGVDALTSHITLALQTTQLNLGRVVQAKESRAKSWWDPDKLNPILKLRNRARQWMLLAKTDEACHCYKEWNDYFRAMIREAKLSHWRTFLETKDKDIVFNALRRINPTSSNQILPLKRADGSFAVGKAEQARMLFEGTSLFCTQIDLSDVKEFGECRPAIFDKITDNEVARATSGVAAGKAPGPDQIRNKTLKLVCPALNSRLTGVFNQILSLGRYPSSWKLATTAIIRKANKPSYTSP